MTSETKVLAEFFNEYSVDKNIFSIGIRRNARRRGGWFFTIHVLDKNNIEKLPRFFKDTPVVVYNFDGKEIAR